MKDNFSGQASQYSIYRPDYPGELYDFILSHVVNKHAAWDCATGNGQAAKVLARHFENVYATDISKKQLDEAVQMSNIHYSLQEAERTTFADNSFDLITIAQALHWFATDNFFDEVKRTTVTNGMVAAWTYGLITINEKIDDIISELYRDVLGEFWDKERKYVDELYQTIPFPFEEIPSPSFRISRNWTIDELAGYLGTWSATQKFISLKKTDPVRPTIDKLLRFWKKDQMEISFPVALRLGIVRK